MNSMAVVRMACRCPSAGGVVEDINRCDAPRAEVHYLLYSEDRSSAALSGIFPQLPPSGKVIRMKHEALP